MRSADAVSDHHLVVAVIKMKLLALKKPSSSSKKCCTYRFKDQTVRKAFFIALADRYDTLYNEPVDERSRSLERRRNGFGHALLNKIWNEEDIPQDWKVGLLVTLPKKGDLCLRKNWRGIMLLTVASKVLCKIILERMKDALDSRALRCAFR